MTETNDNQLELSRHPTALDEQKTSFSNADDARKDKDQAHELKLLKQRQGTFGKFIGSTDSSVNTAFIVILLSFLLLVGCFVGIGFKVTEFQDMAKTLLGVIGTFGGYIFGKSNGSKNE